MTSILIVPGLHGSEELHWQTLWEQELPHCVRVNQDDWHTADLQTWSTRLLATAKPLENFWIIAHSFGVLASLHALPHIIDRVAGVFLVAPADPDKFSVRHLLPEIQPGLSGTGVLAGAIVASRSDPWMSWEKANELATHYGLAVLDAGNAGHINIESGHGAWPQGLQWFYAIANGKPV